MPQHIVIVGGGVGGTIVANLLARHLHLQETKVTLIENTGKHAYMPIAKQTSGVTLYRLQ